MPLYNSLWTYLILLRFLLTNYSLKSSWQGAVKMKPQKIHIVGGGFGGFAGGDLRWPKEGSRWPLHERRPDMRRVDIPAGRVHQPGCDVTWLKRLGEGGPERARPGRRYSHEGPDAARYRGKNNVRPLWPEGERGHPLGFAGLAEQAAAGKGRQLPQCGDSLQPRCLAYDQSASTLTFINDEAESAETVPAGGDLGADGAWSVLRKTMLEHVKDFNYCQEFLEHGYKELIMPAAAGRRLLSGEKRAAHLASQELHADRPAQSGRQLHLYPFFPHEGDESFAALQNERDVLAFFTRAFPDAVPLLPTLAKDFLGNPTGSMVTVKCKPWHIDGKVMLLGDAAHAIVPFFGQGMNCGFEDCSVLGELMAKHGDRKWSALFDELELSRKPNADAIADMALENFIEMRDTVADAKFQFKKQIGFELERRYPDQFIPRYAMVVFHPEIPYAQARQRSEIQDKILEELCSGVSSVKTWIGEGGSARPSNETRWRVSRARTDGGPGPTLQLRPHSRRL